MASQKLCPTAGTEVGAAAASLVGAAAVGRMLTGGSAGGPLPALLGAALVGFGVTALLRRTRLTPPLGAVCATVAVVVVAVWFGALHAARGSFPTASAFVILPTDLRNARGQLSSFHLPLHGGPGLVVLAAVLTGLSGLASRLLLGPLGTRRPRLTPALALLPAAGLVAWSCLAVSGDSGPVLAGGLAAAATVALAAPADRERGPHQARSGRLRSAGWAVSVGSLAVAAAVGVGIPLGVASARGGQSSVPATALSLATGLVGIEHHDAGEVMFRARSPVPTYWQVGVLTVWRDDHWVAGPAGPATPPPTAPAAKRFGVSVTIAHLASRLLPVPPSTVSASAPGATLSGQGVTVPSAPRPGDTYRARAATVSVGSATTGETTGLPAAQQVRMLALPPISPVVTRLAHQVTGAASPASPLAQAEELVNWFRSGQFRYTLTPPVVGGTDPLVAFLTITKAGTCESFAGAFAVMARSLGLPTRVAVGFTSGRPSPGGTATVTGADAHAWPEVYLGTALGWVSFEPTPQQPSGSIAPSDVVGPTVATVPPPQATTPTTGPSTTTPTATAPPTVPATTPTTAPSTPTTSPPPTTPVRARHRQAGGGIGWWPVLPGAAAVVVVGGLVAFHLRRRRRSAPPSRRVAAAYGRVERALRRAGLARPASRTPVAHARALITALQLHPPSAGAGADQLAATLADLWQLAQLVERAGYGPTITTPREAIEAEAAAGRIRRALRRPLVRYLATGLGTPPPRTARRATSTRTRIR